MKASLIVGIVMLFLAVQTAHAVKESGANKTIKKLQMMVKEASDENDRLKADNVKLTGELDVLKKKAELDKKDKDNLVSKEKKLNGEIEFQKQNVTEMRGRLDAANAKIHEIIAKYNGLNQDRNNLATEHEQLKNTQQFTSSELKRCETNNIKMYEGAKKVIGGYTKCQDKGIVDTLLDSEPFTQINSVEFESLAQEYEDKLRKQQFHKAENSASKQ